MAAQRFLNNFDWAFIGPVTASTHVGFESTIGVGILQISDAASALLTTLTGGDWYVLTGYKRAGSVESAIEIIKVLGVNEVAYAAPGECRIRVERGHEGSALQTYVAGDLISMRITAGGLNNLASDAELTAHTGNVSNPHAVTKAQVGLGNVDNTSDVNKPVSTAQAVADTAATNAAKAYADGLVVGLWDDRGNFNASVNTYPTTGGSGAAGAILKGDIWTISVIATAGPLLGYAVGSTVRAVVDTPAQVAGNWAAAGVGLGYVPENTANKDASGGYPSLIGQAVKIWNAAKTFYTALSSSSTANRSISLPDKDGTVALTSDLLSLRNKIINGKFDVWQRGTSKAIGAVATYVSDRWMGHRSGGVAGMTVSRQAAGLAGFRYCARVQRDSGNTSAVSPIFEQDLETSESIFAQGVPVTVSFWARKGADFSEASSNLLVVLYSGTGTDQNNVTAAFTGAATVFSANAALTTSWQHFQYTGTPGAAITQLGLLFGYSPGGTAGAADYFEITGVQLESGSVSTPFEHRPQGAELALCQRYYYRVATDGFCAASNESTLLSSGIVNFPVPLRVAAASLEQSGTATNYTVYEGVTVVTCNSVPVLLTGGITSAFVRFQVAAGLTLGRASILRNAGGYLGFSAEL